MNIKRMNQNQVSGKPNSLLTIIWKLFIRKFVVVACRYREIISARWKAFNGMWGIGSGSQLHPGARTQVWDSQECLPIHRPSHKVHWAECSLINLPMHRVTRATCQNTCPPFLALPELFADTLVPKDRFVNMSWNLVRSFFLRKHLHNNKSVDPI